MNPSPAPSSPPAEVEGEDPARGAPAPAPAPAGRMRRLLARFGVAGFLFFLIKGLLWLVAPAALVALGLSC